MATATSGLHLADFSPRANESSRFPNAQLTYASPASGQLRSRKVMAFTPRHPDTSRAELHATLDFYNRREVELDKEAEHLKKYSRTLDFSYNPFDPPAYTEDHVTAATTLQAHFRDYLDRQAFEKLKARKIQQEVAEQDLRWIERDPDALCFDHNGSLVLFDQAWVYGAEGEEFEVKYHFAKSNPEELEAMVRWEARVRELEALVFSLRDELDEADEALIASTEELDEKTKRIETLERNLKAQTKKLQSEKDRFEDYKREISAEQATAKQQIAKEEKSHRFKVTLLITSLVVCNILLYGAIALSKFFVSETTPEPEPERTGLGQILERIGF